MQTLPQRIVLGSFRFASAINNLGLLNHDILVPSCSGAAAGVYSTQAQPLQLAHALSAPPQSLFYDRGELQPPPDLDNKFGRFLMRIMGFYSHKSRLLHGGQTLYDAVKEQVDDGALHRAFGLDPKVFFSTYTLLSLHMWLIIHRLGSRTDPDAKWFKQRLYNHFQNDVERRIYASGVEVGVSRWTKKLENIFYSSGIALDQVLSGESKDSFTDVILLNFFGNEAVKRGQAALIAGYLQRELRCLQETDDDAIMGGHVRFSQEPFKAYRK